MCKVELIYRVGRLQSIVNHAKVRHLHEANGVLSDAIETATQGLTFLGGAVDWGDDMITLTVTDASWSGESLEVNGKLEALHSQKARLVGLAGSRLINGSCDYIHPICIASKTIKRVCKSTLQSETQALQWGVEAGARIRATIADARGHLGDDVKLPRGWEQMASISMRHLWFTDCKSLSDHLSASTLGQVDDKRLSIDLMSMRRDIWSHGGVELEQLDDWKFGDKVRWIDTSIMAVDCLTKVMPADFLTELLRSNRYDITPDPASTAKKVKKRVHRAKKTSEKPDEHVPCSRGCLVSALGSVGRYMLLFERKF